MTVTIIQGLGKECNKKKQIIVEMLVAMCHSEISDWVLNPQAYLH